MNILLLKGYYQTLQMIHLSFQGIMIVMIGILSIMIILNLLKDIMTNFVRTTQDISVMKITGGQ